jgi:hypothetical protein
VKSEDSAVGEVGEVKGTRLCARGGAKRMICLSLVRSAFVHGELCGVRRVGRVEFVLRVYLICLSDSMAVLYLFELPLVHAWFQAREGSAEDGVVASEGRV